MFTEINYFFNLYKLALCKSVVFILRVGKAYTCTLLDYSPKKHNTQLLILLSDVTYRNISLILKKLSNHCLKLDQAWVLFL